MSINDDLNSTITSAINARIESAVVDALTSDETMRTYVSAALNKEVDVRGSYGRDKSTFLNQLLGKTVEEKTKDVVADEINKFEDLIREHVREALQKSIGVIADSLVDGFVENTGSGRPSIEVNFHAG